MHPFTLSRPTDVSAAIAAHAQNAQLAFIAGGTDLIGLMKDRVTLPDHLLDINRLARDVANRSAKRRWAAHRRVGANERCGSEPGREVSFPGHRRKSTVRRIGPTPKYGDYRREHHAAYPLRLFPG